MATWQMNYFFGATYLFIINSIYIAFATFIGVKLMKYKGVRDADDKRAKSVRRIVYSLAVLTMLPSIYLTYNMLKDSRFTMEADKFIAHECDFPDTQVLSRKAYFEKGERCLSITLIGKLLPSDSLRLALTPRLKYYGLAGTKLYFIQGGGAASTSKSDPLAAQGVGDIYRIAQNTITRQQSTIDSLEAVIEQQRVSALVAPEIAPEIKVLFPQIKDVAVASTVFSVPGESVADTANIALIHTKARFGTAERRKLEEYLEARLKVSPVEVVEVP